jgi:hypothetical protein
MSRFEHGVSGSTMAGSSVRGYASQNTSMDDIAQKYAELLSSKKGN